MKYLGLFVGQLIVIFSCVAGYKLFHSVELSGDMDMWFVVIMSALHGMDKIIKSFPEESNTATAP